MSLKAPLRNTLLLLAASILTATTSAQPQRLPCGAHALQALCCQRTAPRRAFPSFAEPALKAPHDLALVLDAADTAISNTTLRADTSDHSTGNHPLKFASAPKMSTYLVAFLVGDSKC